ncbi:MAG: PKD domain-containing protein [Bacteroidota bacterium]|nr:PKD domain-containing protein [Bacteroidota bacterium]
MFQQDWKNKSFTKSRGWKQFKRWESFMEPRVYPTGNINRTAIWEYKTKSNNKSFNEKSFNLSKWESLGPFAVPTGRGGAGRINCIRFHPLNPDIIFIGSPSGGLWKSTDGGNTWSSNTDNLPSIGVTDIVINPDNPKIMYLITGDGDAGQTYSIGILKSTDGGITWETTGLNWKVSSLRKISKLVIYPTNSNILFVATSLGIYKSSDAGSNWKLVKTGDFKDIEFKPDNPAIIYASGTKVFKSDNSGEKFYQIMTDMPTENRIAIAVTKDAPDNLYVLASNNSYGFLGFYKSTDAGVSFKLTSYSPNILGWDADGNDTGGQSWYDLALAVSPVNKDLIYTGGVNIWQSTDGGYSWTPSTHWFGANSIPYVHADIHSLEFHPKEPSTIYAGCDGGIFKIGEDGVNWIDLSNGLSIGQIYKIGCSANNPDLIMSGWQDNGTNFYNNGQWSTILGGDGMECAIDYTNSNYKYATIYYGQVYRSQTDNIQFQHINSQVTEKGDWITPFLIDPVDPKILYEACINVWRSSDRGDNWSKISQFDSTENLHSIAVSPSNNKYIYTATYSNIFMTSDGGIKWNKITNGLPADVAIKSITINPYNPNAVWVSMSGYSSGNKVFYSNDGGKTWKNCSGSLPNLPVNCIVYENGSKDGLYVGTDVGVYYKDNTMNDWITYSNGLPDVIVNDLEIKYNAGKIRAGTFGRGLWQADLFSINNSKPLTEFYAVKTNVCAGHTTNFTDNSKRMPTSWKWILPGADDTISYSQNPTVTYSTPGIYDAILITANQNGNDTLIKKSYISVYGTGNKLPFSENFESQTFDTNKWDIQNTDNSTTWEIYKTSLLNYAARVNLYNYTTKSQRDALVSKPFDLSGYSDITLSFEHSYRMANDSCKDSLLVYVSTDCGKTFPYKIFAKGGKSLQTNSIINSDFVPSAQRDWCNSTGFAECNNISLIQFTGNQNVIFKFETYNDKGNNIYLDNIKIDGKKNNVLPVAGFSSDKVNSCVGSVVSYYNQTKNSYKSLNWTFEGGSPDTSTEENPVIIYNNPGKYSVTLIASDSIGTDTLILRDYITVSPPPVINDSTVNLKCYNSKTGSIYLNLSGGMNPLKFLWSTGDTTSNIKNISAGNYSVYVSDYNKCIVKLNNIVVKEPQKTIIKISTKPAYTCKDSSGSASISLINATPPLKYSWSNGDTGITAKKLAQGIYTVSVIDSNRCNYNTNFAINIINPLLITVLNKNNVTCMGQANGSITIKVTGGTIPYTYSWSNNNNNNNTSLSNLSKGLYRITVYDNDHCQTTDTIQITDPQAISVIVNATPEYNNKKNGSATIIADGGTPPYEYQWSDSASQTTSTAINLTSGTYRVTVKDINNCQYITAVEIPSETGIEELTVNRAFKIYPNPAQNILFISNEISTNENFSINVYNNLGVLILSPDLSHISKSISTLNISNYSQGLYFINISTKERNYYYKFIKEY